MMALDVLIVCVAQAAPVHDQRSPLVPETVHAVILVALHERVVVLPLRTRSGLTVKDMTGAGGRLHVPPLQP